jgi:hypothetical protein
MQLIEYARKVQKQTPLCEHYLPNDEDLLNWLIRLGETGWIPIQTPQVHDYNKGYEAIFYRILP